ncbi:MAG: hypothetical protein A2068_04375 [Ignavibacteria bacterium GWB2_35_6b]|nr:MAG: hypothetical protein A2068_04375 [Ignavibacteria bacterium GWB2_35_6b]
MKTNKKISPPFLAELLMKFFFPDYGKFTTLGDLNEMFYSISKEGIFKAKLWYWKEVIKSILPVFSGSIYWGANMFKNYIKMGYRNITGDKVYSFINLTGLIIGFTSFILISLFVYKEYSFDDFHKNGERIYRLNKIFTPLEGEKETHPISSGMMAQAIVNNYPEVESAVRVFPWFNDVYIKHDENILKLQNFVAVDSNFFSFFDFKLLKGNPKTALVEPMSVVLSEETAYKLFGVKNPIGETLTDLNGNNFKVTGVAENPPGNSHLQYEVLISWSSTVPGVGGFSMPWLNNWLAQALFTYVTVKPTADINSLEEKLQTIIKDNLPQKVDQYYLYLQPFKDIYLGSADIIYSGKILGGNADYVKLFFISAILILVIASFNYINLTSARSLRRAKEVGVRKTLGAHKDQILKQFLSESLLFTSAAAFASIILVKFLLPYFNELAQKNYSVDWSLLILSAFVLSITISLVSGFYPALLLSNLNLSKTLKGQLTANKSRSFIRKTTVGFQFVISIILITSTIVVFNQMDFVMNKNMGFQKDQMLLLEIGNSEISNKPAAFKNELLKNPNVLRATVTSTVPGLGTYSGGIKPEGKSDEEDWTCEMFRIDDFDLLDVFDMKMAQGRFFSKYFPSDSSTGIVINETLAKYLGWQNPIGKKLDIPGDIENGKVIGVIKDFNMSSLYQPVNPLVIFYQPNAQNVVLKLNAANINSTIDFIKNKWETFAAGYPFEYKFLDEAFEQMYVSDLKMRNMFSLFAGFAIFVSCLGLIGLVSYSSQLRAKEIGIRKVLGSSSGNIVFLLSKEFITIVAVSIIISLPVSYYLMNDWLQSFAYRMELNFISFLFAGIISSLPALIVLVMLTLRAANINPVVSLKNE